MSARRGNKRAREDEEEKVVLQNAEKLLEKRPQGPYVPQEHEVQDDPEDGAGSDGEEYIDMNDVQDEELQVDFDVNIPDFQKDYFGVELFLKNYLNANQYDYVQLTELVLGDEEKDEPNPLTSVIKVPYDASEDEKMNDGNASDKKSDKSKNDDNTMSDDENENAQELDPEAWDWNLDTYGFITCLDYRKHKKLDCMKQIRKYAIDNAPDKLKDQVTKIFDEGRIGILLNERVLNMPIEFGPMLHENLHNETHEDCKKNGTLYKYFFILSKIFYQKSALDTIAQNKKVKAEPLFQKPEEEYYFNRAAVKYTFPLKFDYTYDANAVGMEYNMERKGVAMFVEAKFEKIQKLLAAMKKDLAPAQEQYAQQ